jgi:tetratricopeptide (TPR) repeat protein
VERRLTVHAGADAEEVIAGRGSRGWIVALAVVSIAGAASSADARPKRRDARRDFDRGVAAYQKGNYEAASDALGKSYAAEHDADTLFAWAQTERKLEHCDKAMELYQLLLAFNLPVANKTAVEQKITECREIIAVQAPRPEATPPPAPPATPSVPAEPVIPPPAPPAPAIGPLATSPDAPPPAVPPAYTWYRDPITLALLGAGVVGTGIGAGFLISARTEHLAVADAANLDEARQHSDNARSRRNLGFITGGLGVALLGGGATWLMLHRGSGERRTVTGWLAPGGGGLAIGGAF